MHLTSSCHVQGTLPVRWGLNQAFGNALQMLNVSENKLRSVRQPCPMLAAPPAALLTCVTSVAVLRGTLPDWGSDGSLPQLYQLYLHNNSIAGTVPLAWQNGTW